LIIKINYLDTKNHDLLLIQTYANAASNTTTNTIRAISRGVIGGGGRETVSVMTLVAGGGVTVATCVTLSVLTSVAVIVTGVVLTTVVGLGLVTVSLAVVVKVSL
jgi:hypothetical protein